MNGFGGRGLDAADFDEKDGPGLGSGLRTFDAFPKTKSSYTTRHARGGQWTVFLLLVCLTLAFSELRRWRHGHETREFGVEAGVGRVLQINLDVVVAMHCDDLHVNVQDASGDLILAGAMLSKDETSWAYWRSVDGVHPLNDDHEDHATDHDDDYPEFDDDYFDEIVALAGSGSQSLKKTPKRKKGTGTDACRIWGSMELNKVQGDFHITARGHGYVDWSRHLDHSAFNFSHVINELSFGPLYPNLRNPLDLTVATTAEHFYKFQYYLSVVPTIYTTVPAQEIPTLSSPPSAWRRLRSHDLVFTNQYAVTENGRAVGERHVPGVFFKFDIEPILLLIRHQRQGFLRLLIRLINVLSGVLVAGGWLYQLFGTANSPLVRALVPAAVARRLGLARRAGGSAGERGVLDGKGGFGHDD